MILILKTGDSIRVVLILNQVIIVFQRNYFWDQIYMGWSLGEVPLYTEVAVLLVMLEADAAGVVPSLLMWFCATEAAVDATDATAAASR